MTRPANTRTVPPSAPSKHGPTRRAAALAAAFVCLLALTGCSLFRKKSPPSPTAATATAATAAAATAAAAPSAPVVNVELGRIISLQPEARTALVEFVPQARPPANLAGRALLARKLDTLEVTARLVASPHQRGRIFGVYVISGTPALDDEVVLAPEN